jgi:pimeloyl-ACP methyl ester carboxylesterase
MQIHRSRHASSPLYNGWIQAAALGAAGLAASAVLVRFLTNKAESEHRQLGELIDIDNTRIHYVDRGSGPVVIVLHGNGAMLEEMDSSGVLEHLAKSHRVIALDRPGFGLSSRPEGHWTPERESKLLFAFMRKLGLDRPVIVAHSWATLVAVNLALDEPDAISGLVLIGGYFYPTTRTDVAIQSFVATPIVGDVFRHTLMSFISRAVAPMAFDKMFAPRTPPQAFLEAYSVAMATRPSQLGSVAFDTVEMPIAAGRLASRYTELLIPIALIAGAGDQISTLAHQSRRLNGELPNSTIDEVPDAGHMLHHAYPDLVERRVAQVFERTVRPIDASLEPAS